MSNNYANLTVVELKKIAKEKGVKGYSTMRKAELLEVVKTSSYATNATKKTVAPKKTAKPKSILRKRPVDALLPISITTNTNKTFVIYIKPADHNKITFPCTIKSGVVMNYDEIGYEKVKDRISREEYARLANIQLEKEKKMLQSKKVTRKVKFNV